MIDASVTAIVTDIEGTTTDIDFVHNTLFPYARARLPGFLRTHAERPEVKAELNATAELAGQPADDLNALIDTLITWIDEDRKATPLKNLQGLVWRQGYESGDFQGHVYPDAAAALRQWHEKGLALYVYSSGSVEAQKLLFGYSDQGDLTPLFTGYFDTTTGPKREAESYRLIQQAIGQPPASILFLSDILAELDAAREAGLATIQLVRKPEVVTGGHPWVRDFTALTSAISHKASSEESP